MAMMTSLVLLCGLLLLGGEGTMGQLTPDPTENIMGPQMSPYLMSTLLRHMVNTNEDLAALKVLFDPSLTTSQQQQPDDDYVSNNYNYNYNNNPTGSTGPTFAMQPQQQADMDDDYQTSTRAQQGSQCTCANNYGGQEPDDDYQAHGGSYNSYGSGGSGSSGSGSQGTDPVSLLSLLGLMDA